MKIVFTKSSEEEILSLEKPLRNRVFHKISLLANDPNPFGSQKLESGMGYRIRVGDYRIVYQVNKKELIIIIIKVRHRKDFYR